MRTVNAREIEHFAKDSGQWWDADGPFRPLHRLNPVRLSYIKDRVCTHFGLDGKSLKSLSGLSVLDIGCGGGLVCEPMARMGGTVTGIDADANAIAAAAAHADDGGLSIQYRTASSDDLIAEKKKFDIVLALEIVEHVDNLNLFVTHCVSLCKPGGIIVFSTLNRTPKSFALAKVAAEYILGWVPHGTHDWKKFVKPSELARAIRQAGADPVDTEGMIYHPLRGTFLRDKDDVSVNYFMTAIKP